MNSKYKGYEIDFILKNEQIGIECKFGNIGKIDKIIFAAKKSGIKKLIILGQDYVKFDIIDNITVWTIPWWMI